MKRREKTMIYGYARVSSKGQLRDGNGLEEQREKLLQAGCQEIVEEQYTGTTMNKRKAQQQTPAGTPEET